MRHVSRIAAAALITACAASTATPGHAKVVAKVDLAEQEMHVYVDGKLKHSWQIASGRQGLETPTGSYQPQRLEKDWRSRKFDDAPMPYSVFFSGGYAIHGGYSNLGRPASHGCIRLRTADAAKLYNLISEHGSRATRIEIDD